MTETAQGRLAGKRAFVTGAGQGMGRAIALAFAREGAAVWASDRSGDAVGDTAALSDSITPVVLDVTDPVAISRELAQAGPIDVLANCAGWVHAGTIIETTDRDWELSFATNVTSMFHTIKAVVPQMLERGGGSIVNISSVVSSVAGVPNRAAYGASKAAIIGLTKSVAADYIRDGIRCNAICPGTTASPSLEGRIAAFPDAEAARAAFIARQPMGRFGRPEEMAEAALWLASDESAFATGIELVIDGGQSL
jgi:2-keto-3-deoxy-L-fuconate dehydrogenase